MTKELTQFEEQITLAINKFARGVPWQDRDDLRQEARIAVLSWHGLEPGKDEGLAYKIARNRIINVMRSTPPPTLDIDDPSVRRLAEKSNVHFPDLDTKLDAEKAVSLTYKLSLSDALFVHNMFGLLSETPRTIKQMAELLDKSESWVEHNKRRILNKLKTMMENK